MTRRRKPDPRPVSRFDRWASFARGALSHVRAGMVPPLHPVLMDDYYEGRSAASSGLIVITDPDGLAAMIQHVWAGNPPHTFRGDRP